MNFAMLKADAKADIKGNVIVLFLMMLVVSLITSAAAAILPGVGSLLVTPIFSLALCHVFLKLSRGSKPEFGELFAHFSDFVPALLTGLLTALYTFLWSLLFVIPGIIKAISYSQAMYILAENPGMSATDAINRSKAIMDGHKMEYFLLNLSFIGWHILGAVTCGIAYIWVLPYLNATLANFYQEVSR